MALLLPARRPVTVLRPAKFHIGYPVNQEVSGKITADERSERTENVSVQERYRIDALLADHGGGEKGRILFLPYLYAQNSQATLLRCQSTPCTRRPYEYPIECQRIRVLLNEPNDTDAKTASLKHVKLFQDVWYRASISVDDIAQDPRL